MCRRNKGQSRRRRLICSRRRACSEEFKLTMIGEGTAVSGATLGGFALSGVAKEVCRGPYQFLPSVRPMPWFDLELTDDTIAAEQLRTYVRQLELIEHSEEDVMEAINNFLRASAERAAWSEAGIVHDDSFDEYEASLTTYWKNKR